MGMKAKQTETVR